MSRPITIALDAMGGDFGPEVVVPAAANILRRHDDLMLILVGDNEQIARQIEQQNPILGSADRQRLQICHTSQTVGMDEAPALALRGKKDSSMRVAINCVREGTADACVSAGNTGALMATARFVLKTLPGVDRPAIIASVPSIGNHVYMLDLGANVDCTAEHLFQFAVMGSVLAGAVDDRAKPRVGLLNVGQEIIKGNEQVKGAHRLLSDSPLNYIGFVEADGIYADEADVVVCDGFVGNVSLKTSEGVAKIISHYARQEFGRNWLTKLAGAAARPVLKAFRHRIDPRRYNGASLLGLQGIVIKSHGGADTYAFENAIDIARIEAQKAVPRRIGKQLETLLAANTVH